MLLGRAVFQAVTGSVVTCLGGQGGQGGGKGSRGENHMFPGMLGSVVGEQWEAHGHQHENIGGAQLISGWSGTDHISRLIMLLTRRIMWIWVFIHVI